MQKIQSKRLHGFTSRSLGYGLSWRGLPPLLFLGLFPILAHSDLFPSDWYTYPPTRTYYAAIASRPGNYFNIPYPDFASAGQAVADAFIPPAGTIKMEGWSIGLVTNACNQGNAEHMFGGEFFAVTILGKYQIPDGRMYCWPAGSVVTKSSCPYGGWLFVGFPHYLGICSRPNAYTITLAGGDEVEPTKDADIKFLPIIATVKDQSTGLPPTTPVTVKVSLKVDPTSGGHVHGDNARPRGGIANIENCPSDETCWTKQTDANGQVVFNFNAPEAAGKHTISVSCDGCNNNPQEKPVDVKVDGLEKIPEVPFLYTIKLPNRDTNHPATYYLTRASAEKLKMIALYYYAFTFRKPKQGVLPDFVLNDASLEWGGVLDCFLTCNSAQYPSTPWHKHHIEHRRGTVIDVKANGTPGSVVYDRDFRFWAAEFGVDVGGLHGSGSGLHYHIRLNNIRE